MGKEIAPGDVVLAFTSSGLHTNGYSLARKLLFDIGKFNVNTRLPELSRSLGEVLLEPHINYTRPVLEIIRQNIVIKGMAHITGGGLLENIPRILPAGARWKSIKTRGRNKRFFPFCATWRTPRYGNVPHL